MADRLNIITAEMVLNGYFHGVFPMAERDSSIYWYQPNPRAIIPLENYKPQKSLKSVLNKGEFELKINADFESVIRNCSKPRFEGDGVWISEEIIQVYKELNLYGFAHSVEAWKDNQLAGGLYGVALGKVFFGESMFHHQPNASKVAFHYLISRLKERSFKLLDTQFINDNVLRFGAIEISQKKFMRFLSDNISLEKCFYP